MIAIITAEFNSEITDKMQASAIEVLKKENVEYEIFRVPGAVELPIMAQRVIRKNKPKAVICLGCVIKGDTDHYDLVLKSCTEGLTRVALDESTPIMHGVLACHDSSDALSRLNLGAEYAETAIRMME